MTNLSSIAGGALWVFLSVLLVSVALEPVSVKPQTQYVETAATARAA